NQLEQQTFLIAATPDLLEAVESQQWNLLTFAEAVRGRSLPSIYRPVREAMASQQLGVTRKDHAVSAFGQLLKENCDHKVRLPITDVADHQQEPFRRRRVAAAGFQVLS